MGFWEIVKSLFRKGSVVNNFAPLIVARSERPMLVPPFSVLSWRELPSKQSPFSSISVLFAYEHAGRVHHIALKRPIDEDFDSFASKLRGKVAQAAFDVPKRNSLPSEINLDIVPESQCKNQNVLEVIEASSSILIGESRYRVLREPADISSVNVFTIPFANVPVFPCVDLRPGREDLDIEPVYHWFVLDAKIIANQSTNSNMKNRKDKVKSKQFVTPQLKLRNGASGAREFEIEGCEFRGIGPTYVPTADDVGKYLIIVADLGSDSITRAGFSKHAVRCIEEPLLSQQAIDWCSSTIRPDNSVRVVSFNILADLYLNLSGPQNELFFPYCPKEFQHYEYRYPLILNELRGYNADLYFLQEVDVRMNIRYLAPLFKSMGMEVNFGKKLKEVNEGTAIAYRTSKYTALASHVFGIDSLRLEVGNEDACAVLNSNEEGAKFFAGRPTILQVVVLQDVTSGDVIIAANTHLHHDPKHEHLKFLQSLLCVRKLYSFLSEWKLKTGRTVRILFGGDFNSTPYGPAFRLFREGVLPETDACWSLEPKLTPATFELDHNLKNMTGTPSFTNFTRNPEGNGFVGTLDYIWSDGFETVTRAPEVSEEQASRHTALPSKVSPSDHIALIVDIRPTVL